MAFDPRGDMCLGFWRDVYEADVLDWPQNANILEVGCAEADWIGPMKAEKPDLFITGLDWRACERPAATTLIKGDVLIHEFTESTFDGIVLVSALEHIGLGAYDDPRDEDGDIHAMARFASWLKPGGWVYADVPYRPDGYLVNEQFRGYDDRAIEDRLTVHPLQLTWRREFASSHRDGPYIAMIWRRSV